MMLGSKERFDLKPPLSPRKRDQNPALMPISLAFLPLAFLALALTSGALVLEATCHPASGWPKKAAVEEKEVTPPEQRQPSVAALESQKLLKTLKTPFGACESSENDASQQQAAPLSLLSLTPEESAPAKLSLAQRLNPPQLFLPGHMILGKTVAFIVKAKPGNWVALAMADKDSGAKPIYGHKIRLGADRKVVAAAQIPDSGMVTLSVDTPVEGDLIDQCLYFEAAIWSKPDFCDVEIAKVIPSERQDSAPNGVLIAAETNIKRKGIKIGADNTSPLSNLRHSGTGITTGIDSGKP